jgi:hypothetical protein
MLSTLKTDALIKFGRLFSNIVHTMHIGLMPNNAKHGSLLLREDELFQTENRPAGE